MAILLRFKNSFMYLGEMADDRPMDVFHLALTNKLFKHL